MLCEECHQREAMVKFTQVIGSEKKAVNLCSECAEKQGLNNPLFDISKVFGKIILAILSEHLQSKSDQATVQSVGKVCSGCGLSWSDFEKAGRLGCPRCYEEHEENLKALLRRIHGSNRHFGKPVNGKKRKKESLSSLRKQLEQAVLKEEYEAAAELRDRIREIRHQEGTSAS